MSRYTPTIEASVPPTPVVPAAEAGPTPTGLKKLSFGGITKKKEDTKTAYPVFPEDPAVAELAARIIERQAQFDALEGALKTDKAEIKVLVSPFYFTHNHGKLEVPSSVSVRSPAGEVLVTFQNRYAKLADEKALLPILGERTGAFFRQAFKLTIDGDKLPLDKAQELLGELQELFARYQASDALEVTEGVKPCPDFHARRHIALNPEENLALDQACPIVAQIKTKGRK
jgi:hypothetical protein